MMSFVRTAGVLATVTGLATVPGLASPAQAQLAQIRVIDGDGAPVGLTSVVVRPVGIDAAIARRLTSSAGTLTTDPSVGATRNRVTDSVEINDPRRRDSTNRDRDGSYTARSGNTLSIRVFDECDLIDETFTAFVRGADSTP